MSAPWWQRALRWLQRLLGMGSNRPQLREGEAVDELPAPPPKELPDHLAEQLEALDGMQGAARDSVDRAVSDYLDLKKVLLGPGASSNAVDDVEMLANAEEALGRILERAPQVWTLSTVAGKRNEDQKGREAAGEALLALRDQSKALHATASAAIQWAASRSEDDQRTLRDCAERLGRS